MTIVLLFLILAMKLLLLSFTDPLLDHNRNVCYARNGNDLYTINNSKGHIQHWTAAVAVNDFKFMTELHYTIIVT